ncbi:MAG: MOP flippase family protein [Bacteroidales bacterium]|nr:MOP flippase family protein [Bacteroidales bacterium]
MGLAGKTTSGIVWTTVSAIVRSVVGLLQVSILTRLLTKADFGIVAIANIFIGFTHIFLDLGLSSGILHKQGITSREYSSLFWLNVMMGALLTAILCAITPLVARAYNEPSLIRILSLLSLTIFFYSFGSQHRTVQQKQMQFRTMALIEIFAALITISSAVFLALKGFGVYSLVYSTMINAFVTNIVYFIVGITRDHNIRFHFSFRETVPFLKIGVFSIGTQVLDYFSREIDVIIISATLGKDKLGVYSLCKKIVTSLYSLINPIITRILTPSLAIIQKNVEKVRSVYYSIVESLALVNFPIYFLVAIFSYAILFYLYGDQYIDESVTLSLLAVYYGYLSTGNPVGSLQIAMGRTDSGFYWTICRIILFAAAVWIGSFYQIEGIVVCLFVISLLSSPLAWQITIRPLIGGHFLPFFKLSVKPLFVISVIACPFYLFFKRINSIPIVFLLSFLFLSCCFVLFMVLFKENRFVQMLKSRLLTLRTEKNHVPRQ